MRRPLKPFVTEYKAARRPPSNQPQVLDSPRPPASGAPSSGSGSQPVNPQRAGWPSDGGGSPAERPRPRPLDIFAAPESEDAYEAAMRAADALFARPDAASKNAPPKSTPPRSGVTTERRETTDPTSTPQPVLRETDVDHAPPERGGRILQVIDEPPPPQFAALEAEYAPKRRGRKPGSKNKPKITQPQSDPSRTDQPETAQPHIDLQRRDVDSRTIFVEPAEQVASRQAEPDCEMPDMPAVVGDAVPALQIREAIPASDGATRGQRRPMKTRGDQPKPGEAWKRRRLPRVCW